MAPTKKVLTTDEATKLGERVLTGDTATIDTMLKQNEGLVHFAYKLACAQDLHSFDTKEDVLQELRVLLWKCIKSYDYRKGSLSTFFLASSRFHARKAVARAENPVHISTQQLILMVKINRFSGEFYHINKRIPNFEDIPDSFFYKNQSEKIRRLTFDQGIELGITSKNVLPLDLSVAPREIEAEISDKSFILEVKKILTKQQYFVLKQRFGLEGCENRTLASIGAELGRSPTTIQNIEKTCLTKLKNIANSKLKGFYV